MVTSNLTCGSCGSCAHVALEIDDDPCNACDQGGGGDDAPSYWTAPGSDGSAIHKAPDSNPKTVFGMAKPALSLVPGAFKAMVSEAFKDGAAKYGPANWRKDPVSASTYLNACERHMVAWQDGEEIAEDSGVHHLAHAAACLAIILDAQVAGTLLDDRPPACPTGVLMKTLTRPI